VAYVVPAEGSELDVEHLRRLCKARLPPFMVPSAFVAMASLPRTANEKLDRGALPAPDGARPQMGHAYSPPRTPVEEQLAAIWCEVLGVDRVGRDDDFFDLGGHSLLAVRMLARAHESFGVEVHLYVIFERPTIAGLAEEFAARLLDTAGENELYALLAEIESDEAQGAQA
jgi:hypothetical protein